MGTSNAYRSSSELQNLNNKSETQIVLNVYDLTPLNNYTYWLGFGIFHSGIEVHGKEYGFGAHDFPVSGVFEVEPRNCPGFIYRCSITLGLINMFPSEFQTFIESEASEYHGNTYHLISKNCNHFTDDISFKLTGKRIPGWVNRLARLGIGTPWTYEFASNAMTRNMKYSEYMEDGSEWQATTTRCELTEIDDADKEKLLPSLNGGTGEVEVAFVKESHKEAKLHF